MNDKVWVVGVGMTRFARWPDKSVKDLASEAIGLALQDAGCARRDIEVAFFSNATQGALEGQYMIGGQLALRSAGFESIPIVNVENACASGSTAFHLACTQLRGGDAEIAIAVGAEKMYTSDKERSMAALNGAWDVHGVDVVLSNLERLGAGVDASEADARAQRSVFMDVYAALAKQHMRRFGTTQRQLATVAAKNHHHSVANPLAQYRIDYTVEEVLAARAISWPLTLPMCSPISDGAAAVILCREEALPRFDRTRAVRVYASALASGSDRDAEDLDQHICRRAATNAYERAGVGPEDMSVAEVHDATAMGEILQSENLQLCPLGDGGPAAERGDTSIGGRIPINPSGGLESKGHPIGATGLGQIHEIVMQVRGEGGARQVPRTRFAIAENGGGFHGFEEAVACVTILGRA
jgi:acetyl-CoA acetyltransferase